MDALEAQRRLLAWLGDSPPMVVTRCSPSRRGTHWILAANTEEYVRTGDVSRALVGVGAYVVERATGAIEAWGTGVDPEVALEDRHDLALDEGRAWVVRPLPSPLATVRLRRWLACTPAEALRWMRAEAWFTASRREAAEIVATLAGLGIDAEQARVDHAGCAVAPWALDAEGLAAALRRVVPG